MKNQPEKARNPPSLRLSEQSRKDMDKPTINPWCGALTGVSTLYMINWSVKMLTKHIEKYFNFIEVLKTGVKWQFLCNFVP